MSKEGKRFLIIAIVVILGIFALLSDDDGSNGTAKCKSCGRTYEAGDSRGNYNKIKMTNMCNNCYSNFKWSQDMLDAIGD